MKEPDPKKPRLEVYLDRSVLVPEEGESQAFPEGETSPAAQRRLETIRKALEAGFLDKTLKEVKDHPELLDALSSQAERDTLHGLVDAVTSEKGRALVDVCVLQLAIKAIEPKQSVRLHKGGAKGGSFSWVDGIPMRVLDTRYVTPFLRRNDLQKMNADGAFMTRGLAENYPYSKLYKAALRGGRSEWLDMVDGLESGTLEPLAALRFVLAALVNRSAAFNEAAEKALRAVRTALDQVNDLAAARRLLAKFVDLSPHSARLFEVTLHSLFQVLEDHCALDGSLSPLSQMRTANKKHGNVGDIEVASRPGSLHIIEAWDAKYGKPYLREELDELEDKLRDHPETKIVGFVVDGKPNLKTEVSDRLDEVERDNGVKVVITSFADWVSSQATRCSVKEATLAREWLIAFAESIAQKRRNRAPIDEPTDEWIRALEAFAKTWR